MDHGNQIPRLLVFPGAFGFLSFEQKMINSEGKMTNSEGGSSVYLYCVPVQCADLKLFRSLRDGHPGIFRCFLFRFPTSLASPHMKRSEEGLQKTKQPSKLREGSSSHKRM